MGRRARLGLITALAGLLVPIVMFPFTQGQLPLAGFLYNVNRMEVVLYEGERPVGDVLPLKRSSDWGEQVRRGMRQLEQQRLFEEKRIAFPYRYCLLGGAALVFVGLAMPRKNGVNAPLFTQAVSVNGQCERGLSTRRY